jgi:hypothetical protein
VHHGHVANAIKLRVTMRIEIEIEIVYNMCRQTKRTSVSRASLPSHLGLTSEFSPGLFDQVHLSTHLASLCVDVPRELKNCKQ